jgi:hypothetical protein
MLNRASASFLYKNASGCQKDFDRHEKRFGIVNALLDSVAFRIKQHIVVCQYAIVLFLCKDRRQVSRQLAGLDEMLAKESSHCSMRGHIDPFGQKDCACGMEDRVVRPGECIFEEAVAEKEAG